MTQTVAKQDSGLSVDQDLLDEAAEMLGTSDASETVNAALLEVVEKQRVVRRQGLADLRRMANEDNL